MVDKKYEPNSLHLKSSGVEYKNNRSVCISFQD